jgi:hypothetical protein
MTQMDVLSPWTFCPLRHFVCRMLCLRIFCPAGPFVRWMFLSLQMFCPYRRFVSTDVLSTKLFAVWFINWLLIATYLSDYGVDAAASNGPILASFPKYTDLPPSPAANIGSGRPCWLPTLLAWLGFARLSTC